MFSEKANQITPRIIIHGGAGNITRENLPEEAYNAYRCALLNVLHEAHSMLRLPDATALDVATHAVSLLEDNPRFNAGHGAVFTTAETHELEASVMVSRGYRKRGVGVMKVTTARNPIKLAREMLVRGEEEDGGGAQGHCQLEGETCERLVTKWGLETVKPSYYWTKKRWDQHRRGLGRSIDGKTYRKHKKWADEGEDSASVQLYCDSDEEYGDDVVTVHEPSWDGREYLPQGTVGAVVLDSSGTICVATSTGGLTNKLPGRIGDTPTLGAGFWSESWQDIETVPPSIGTRTQGHPSPLASILNDCLPGLSGYMSLPAASTNDEEIENKRKARAVGMSGTGNGDSFLKINAVRTAAAIARFSAHSIAQDQKTRVSLQNAVSQVAGPNGMLQQSAEDRWQKTGEGEGGIIGIDFVDGKGRIVFDFNCGGMFHAWVDDDGKERFQVFRKDD